MKKQLHDATEERKEQMIQDALRSGGFLFPQTVAEVEEFEKKFGTTEVPLPDHLKSPSFIMKSQSSKTFIQKAVAATNENFAMAARDGAPKLPEEVLKKMEEDRKKTGRKKKKNNSDKK